MGKEYPELRLSSEQAASLGVYYNEICRLALGNKVIHVQADIAEDSGESLITLTPDYPWLLATRGARDKPAL